MINNFEQISNLLKFEDENEFYFIQVIQRKKEVADLGRNNRVIKTYYVYNLDKFKKYKEEIIQLCSLFNARAYIHLNRRNSKVIAFEMMELLASNIKNNHFNQLSNLYNSVVGQHHSDKDKTWIIDVDEKTPSLLLELHTKMTYIQPEGNKVVARIETKNGYHLITKSFNSQKFSEIFPDLEIHKNNPTILYCI